MGRIRARVGIGVAAAAVAAGVTAAVVTGIASANTAAGTPAPAQRAHPASLATASTPESAVADQVAKQFIDSYFHVSSTAIRTMTAGSDGWYEVFLTSSADGYVSLVNPVTRQHGGTKRFPLSMFQDVLRSAG